jgi:hypothetical protein
MIPALFHNGLRSPSAVSPRHNAFFSSLLSRSNEVFLQRRDRSSVRRCGPCARRHVVHRAATSERARRRAQVHQRRPAVCRTYARAQHATPQPPQPVATQPPQAVPRSSERYAERVTALMDLCTAARRLLWHERRCGMRPRTGSTAPDARASAPLKKNFVFGKAEQKRRYFSSCWTSASMTSKSPAPTCSARTMPALSTITSVGRPVTR